MGLKSPISRVKNMLLFGICVELIKITLTALNNLKIHLNKSLDIRFEN